jgi:hypothetical protein
VGSPEVEMLTIILLSVLAGVLGGVSLKISSVGDDHWEEKYVYSLETLWTCCVVCTCKPVLKVAILMRVVDLGSR